MNKIVPYSNPSNHTAASMQPQPEKEDWSLKNITDLANNVFAGFSFAAGLIFAGYKSSSLAAMAAGGLLGACIMGQKEEELRADAERSSEILKQTDTIVTCSSNKIKAAQLFYENSERIASAIEEISNALSLIEGLPDYLRNTGKYVFHQAIVKNQKCPPLDLEMQERDIQESQEFKEGMQRLAQKDSAQYWSLFLANRCLLFFLIHQIARIGFAQLGQQK